jgi:hypothetical protein
MLLHATPRRIFSRSDDAVLAALNLNNNRSDGLGSELKEER